MLTDEKRATLHGKLWNLTDADELHEERTAIVELVDSWLLAERERCARIVADRATSWDDRAVVGELRWLAAEIRAGKGEG